MKNQHNDVQFINHFLCEKNVSADLRSVIYHIARSVKYIDFALRTGSTMAANTSNASGETQMAIDVLSDQIVLNELRKSEQVCVFISEEQEEAVKIESSCGKFVVTCDPLDGSSLIGTNLAIGSIFGIWENGGDEFIGKKTEDGLVASCYAVYGPRVIFVVAIKGMGVNEFELNDVGDFVLTTENIKLEENSKYFAPGNLRATQSDNKYLAYVQDCMTKQKTLRYSGGMVPDLHHVLSKKQGIFTYPRMIPKYPEGKLRLLFECAPMAFIFEEAGGKALDQDGKRVLETKIDDIHQRVTIFIGSKNAVDEAVEFLK